jgi:hypothetical protein
LDDAAYHFEFGYRDGYRRRTFLVVAKKKNTAAGIAPAG